MKSAGKARNNGLYRHIRTSKEIIRNLLNDYSNCLIASFVLVTVFMTLGALIYIGVIQSTRNRLYRWSAS